MRERGNEESQASFQDIRSSEGRFSSGQEKKVHRINDKYAWVPEKRDFVKDPKERFQDIEVVGFRRLPTLVSHT